MDLKWQHRKSLLISYKKTKQKKIKNQNDSEKHIVPLSAWMLINYILLIETEACIHIGNGPEKMHLLESFQQNLKKSLGPLQNFLIYTLSKDYFIFFSKKIGPCSKL